MAHTEEDLSLRTMEEEKEETKNLLSKKIDQVLYKLKLIEDCQEQFPEVIQPEPLKQTIEWLNLMKKDFDSGKMPDYYLSEAIDQLNNLQTQNIPETIDDLQSSLNLTNDKEKNFSHISKKRNITKTISNFGNSLSIVHTYTILSKINFAQGNCVIVGPNGCGKTMLAETFTNSFTYKSKGTVIPAQKLLIAPDITCIPLYEETNNHYQEYQNKIKGTKRTYNCNNINSLPYEIVKEYGDEFQNVLMLFCSEYHNIAIERYQEKDNSSVPKAKEALNIWNDLMQEHKLTLNTEGCFSLKTEKDNTEYPIHLMSEGEKEILYLIGRVLYAPQNGYIIVDEPEIHLHKAIVNKLWDKLEQEREDCHFVYLTHDLDFATSRNAQKCWIKRYHYPSYWEIETIEGSEIPENLLLKILGSRKNILFCEGEESSSLDIQIYEILFSNYTIIPSGSCTNVISYTKAFNKIPNRLSNAYGIIDKDFRPEEQLNNFKEQNIYSYDVSEIENLFLIDKFVEGCSTNFKAEDYLKESDFKEKVITEFKKQIERHALNFVTAKINFYYEEQKFHNQNSIGEMEKAYNKFCSSIDIKTEYEDRKKYLEKICEEKNYEEIIKACNNKGLLHIIEKAMKFSEDYTGRALKYLRESDEAKKILLKKFPLELQQSHK